ncbi:Sec-independent protein translocase subunit TatB [Streptomyces sp. NPDC002265]|uniref:Sec-independent protein translocase subunit TatB n=1 Tax=Streptomyces sp. NPDC002265 TaxID=3154415 RepID=UPI003327A635
MLFDIGPLEVATLMVLAVVLVGPDKLPKMVSDIARILRKVREVSRSAQASIRSELPPELADLALEDLNPRTLVAKNLLGGEDLNPAESAADADFHGKPAGSAPARTSKNTGKPVRADPISTAAEHRP